MSTQPGWSVPEWTAPVTVGFGRRYDPVASLPGRDAILAWDHARGCEVLLCALIQPPAGPAALRATFDLAHPNLLALLDTLRSDDGRPFAVWEHAPGFDILTAAQTAAPEALTRALLECLRAVEHLENAGIPCGRLTSVDVRIDSRSGAARLLGFGPAAVEGSPVVSLARLFSDLLATVNSPPSALQERLRDVSDEPETVPSIADFNQEIQALTDTRPFVAAVTPNLVDREEAREALAAWTQEIGTGRGGAITITGAAGLGKTELGREAVALARMSGYHAGALVCSPSGGLESFSRALSMLGASDFNPRDCTPDRLGSELDKVLGGEPAVLVVDQVDAASPEVETALAHLVAGVARRPVLLVLLGESLPPAIQSAAIGVGLRHEGTSLSVRPLNDEALAYLVSRSLCCESLPELTAWISTISAGVPAVALEALRHLSACGRLSGSPRLPDVPPGHDGAALLGALIVERCAQLPASELALLRGLSVMRLPVSAELLARVVEIPAGRAVEALQSLEGRGLAVGAGRWFGQRTWDVCSSAVREAVLADAAPDSVRGLHTRALGVLDGAGFGPERCGPHALASGDALAALRYATSAAGRAEAIGDLDSALTLYSGCVELLRATDQFPDERDELLLAQARVLDEAGEWQRAVEVLDEALHAASDSRLIVECLRRRVLALGRLGNLVEARAAVGRLLDSLDGLPSSDCAASYLAAARVLRVCGALPAAEDAVGRGLAAATSANDGRVRGRLLTERAVLLASRSRADEAIESARGALDEFSAQRDEVGAAHAMEQLARSHRAEAEFSEAQRWHARAAESWERLGRPDGVGRCVGEMGVCAYLGGDVEGAVAHWRRGIRIAELSGDVVQRIGLTNNLGYVWMEAGQLEDAREAFEDGLALASRAGEGTMPATLWGNLGETLFRLDCLSAAEEAYDEAITRAQAQRATTDVLENRRRRCALWLKRGEVDRASAEADQLLAQVGEGASPAQVLALRRLLALIALGKGEDSAGESHIQAAGAVLAGLHGDQPFETALLELVRAETWLAGGALDSAATAVEKASAIFRSIGPSWHDSRCSVLSEQIAESAVAKGSGGDKAPEAIVASVSRLLAVETDPGRCIRLAAESARRLMTAQWSDVWSQATPCRDAQRMGAGPARSTDQSTRLAVESALRAAFDRNAPVESGDGVSVPIPGPRGPAGVLFVGGLDAAPERLPLLETIAACLGGALHRADLQARVDDSRQLLSVASHELRSPLNAIVGYAGLIGELPGLEGDLPEMIALIGEQGERMSGLVSDVRRLASALNPEVRVERVRPDALFEAAVRLATASAGARDVELRLKASSLVQLVDVDNECVTRLLADLIDNATRHSAAGSQVTLDLSVSEKEPGMVAFRVRDRGTGIPPNDLDVIFQRFARGSRPLGEGNGLGLSIARAVARAHGGRLGVVSQDGVGSTFELLVPVVEANYG